MSPRGVVRGVAVPFQVDGRGRTAAADGADHLRDLIEEVLFTSPGERVMRPDFGSGLLDLVFEPGGPELSGTVQFLVQGALGQWLGDLIAVDEVDVSQDDGTLTVNVAYTVLRTQDQATASVTRRTS